MNRRISLDQINYALEDNFYFEEEAENNDSQLKGIKQALFNVVEHRLTPRQKETLILYYYEKKKIPEIAGILQVNKSTVSRTLRRATNNIRRYLEFYQLR